MATPITKIKDGLKGYFVFLIDVFLKTCANDPVLLGDGKQKVVHKKDLVFSWATPPQNITLSERTAAESRASTCRESKGMSTTSALARNHRAAIAVGVCYMGQS